MCTTVMDAHLTRKPVVQFGRGLKGDRVLSDLQLRLDVSLRFEIGSWRAWRVSLSDQMR